MPVRQPGIVIILDSQSARLTYNPVVEYIRPQAISGVPIALNRPVGRSLVPSRAPFVQACKQFLAPVPAERHARRLLGRRPAVRGPQA